MTEEIKGSFPDGVTLRRDAAGVIHVSGPDESGLAWGMGYAHACDRGLQMLMTRILGWGKASEYLAANEETVGIDRFFRRMGWAQGLVEQEAALDGETKALVESYCAGANAIFTKKTPWELRLLGYRAEPWTIADCLLMTRIIGYINLAQSQGDLERLFIEMVQAGVDKGRLDALFPGAIQETDLELIKQIKLGERIVPNRALWGIAPRMTASNNWVVHPSRSATGHALLANDPHLEVNRLPSVWSEIVVSCPGIRAMGATMPGIPGVIIGRTPCLAWGATYTFMDAVDSWIEDCKDGCYRRGDRWVPFSIRTETLTPKKGDPITLTFYENEHGVLDGDPFTPGLYLATRWASAETGAQSIMSARRVMQAQTVEEGMALLGQLETSWNWVLADKSGHIGYQMSGRMPIRKPGWSGFVPAPGWDSSYDWQGFVAPEDLPRCMDPEEGFIVTANQDLNHLGVVNPINAPMGDYRARRITEVLEKNDQADLALFRTLQNDVYSNQGEAFMALIRPHLPDTPQGRILKQWNHHYDSDSVGATLFERIYEGLFMEVFGEDGLGADAMNYLWHETGLLTDFYQHFETCLLDRNSAWWEGKDWEATLKKVVASALARPAEPWGQKNAIAMNHLVLGGKLPRIFGFDRGPITLQGGRATPNQGQIYRSGGRTTCFAPSIRLVTDLGEDCIYTALAGGASDRRFSKWYVSDLERWLAGDYKVVRHDA
jgi:penicillin amidase